MDRPADALDQAEQARAIAELYFADELASYQASALRAEVLETQATPGSLADATREFARLFKTVELLYEQAPERDAGGLLAYCANHLYSLAIKIGCPELAGSAQTIAANFGSLVATGVERDEIASLLQWAALFEMNVREDARSARDLWEMSCQYRADTPRRILTLAFPEAHLLYIEGKQQLALTRLEAAIREALVHGMTRHARRGKVLYEQLSAGA